uniref:Uncharacterized protein n=1 Tax=Romanomermis culicivorax TaxID=13658 RepID=A0A915KVZ0_ROMCU
MSTFAILHGDLFKSIVIETSLFNNLKIDGKIVKCNEIVKLTATSERQCGLHTFLRLLEIAARKSSQRVKKVRPAHLFAAFKNCGPQVVRFAGRNPQPPCGLHFLTSLCLAILKSFFPELPRTSECRHWSLWSKCVSSENYRFNGPFDIPGYCQMDYSLVNYIRDRGPIIETVNHYFNKMNMSKKACGMCNFQYSCGRMCSPAASTDVLMVFPADIQEKISALPGPNCISVEKRCFCCCDPYLPDPVTLTCKLIADDDRKVFRKATDLPRQGRRRFGRMMRK